MLSILVIEIAIAFSNTTLAEESKWRHKPVYCGSIPEVYEEIIDKHDLYPIMAAVGHVNSTYTPETLLSPTVLYINSETKRYVIIEFGHGEGACVTSIGNGIDFDVTEEQVRDLLKLDPKKMKM